jgi:hypothetical protein
MAKTQLAGQSSLFRCGWPGKRTSFEDRHCGATRLAVGAQTNVNRIIHKLTPFAGGC